MVFTRGRAEESKSMCTRQLGFPENAPLHWGFSYESFLGNQQYSDSHFYPVTSCRNGMRMPFFHPAPGQRVPDFKILKQQTLWFLVTAP